MQSSFTRPGTDYTPCLDRIRAAVAALPIGAAVIDGEPVAFDDQGRADFHALRSRDGQANAVLVAYNILQIDGSDVRREPLGLSRFLTRYPRINIEFLVTNRPIDVVAENIDIALRTGELPDSSLIACKIIDLAQIVCASPEYLARNGRPMVPSELTRHRCLTLNGISEPGTWIFKNATDRIAINVNSILSADSSDVLVRLATEGVGIVRLGELAVARAISNGSLEPLLQGAQVRESYPLWALLPPGRQRSSKVKVFLDFVKERIGLAPWRRNIADGSFESSRPRPDGDERPPAGRASSRPRGHAAA